MTKRLIYSCPNVDCTVSTIVVESDDPQTTGAVFCDCTCRMDYEGIE